MDIKIDYSNTGDDSDWHQETFAAISGGVSTETLGVHRFSTTGKYTLALSSKWRYARISAIGNGTITSSSVAIDAILGNV